MKWILAVLVLVLAALGSGAETVKALPKPTGYVSDYAGVLSPGEKAMIEQQCTTLHQQTGTQVAVVTVHRLEGVTAQEFAHGISDAWGVGSKGTDKGVVLLIATDDRKRWIDVGYGLEGALNDAKVGDIGRAMVPALKIGKYGEGIELGVGAISDAILADVGDAGKTVASPAPAPVASPSVNRSGVVALFCVGGLGALVILLILLARRRRWTGPGSYSTPTSPSRSSGFFVSGGESGDSSSSSESGSSSDTSTSSGSDFGGFDGGSSGGGGAGGDF